MHKVSNVINEFFTYCNNKEIQKAYDLLTDDCKERIYDNIDTFKNNYINQLFMTKKIYNIQSWFVRPRSYTYRIEIREDILSSGNADGLNITEDYFTIVEDNGQYKLNINNYIGKVIINKSYESDKIQIIIEHKQQYMDYEEYKIKILNKTDKRIMLDGYRTTDNVYLIDDSNMKRPSYLYEIYPYELVINPKLSIERNIKFSKPYNPEINIVRIVFQDIILDYDMFNKLQNNERKEYNNILNVKIDI